MITTMTLVPIHGTRLPCESRLAYARSWKQRPSALRVINTILGGFPTTDNSTRVSALERRHR
jgi:hypothetical protein